MTIKHKIFTVGAITFVLFVILSLMTIWTHRQVLDNLRIRDQVNQKLAAVEQFARWKSELIRSISNIVAMGHQPPSTDELFRFPLDGFGKERAALVESGKSLVSLIDEKDRAVKDIEASFTDRRIHINSLYYQLDQKITTVLAFAQKDQVLGKDASEINALAPYVLKSLNQLTLVAQNGLIARHFTEKEKSEVANNHRFLSTQLRTIDRDGSIAELFTELLQLIEQIETAGLESTRTLAALDTRISAAKTDFDRVVLKTEVEAFVREAQMEVRRASDALEATSQRTLIAMLICLLVVPIFVILAGILGLNTLVVSPITRLVEAMKNVETGTYDVAAPAESRDEIGELARAFNTMAAEIKAKVAELSALNQVLTVSEAKYRTLVDNLPQRIILKNRNLNYVSCNRHFAQDLGLSLAELAGLSDYDLFPMALADKYRQDDQRVLETEATTEIEESYVRNGQELIVQTVKTPVRDESGHVSGVLGIFWDITERKRAEEDLYLARFSLENASVAVFWLDSEGRFRYVNKHACTMFGYDRDKLLAMSAWDVDVELSPERFAQLWRNMGDGQPIHVESTIKHPDGSKFPVEISARQSEFRGKRLNFNFAIDISARKDAERKMLESRELHRSIIQTAMDGFWVVDLEGRLVEVNEAYCRMSGYSESELLDMNITDLDIQKTELGIRDHIALVTRKSEDRFETRHRHRNGAPFDVEVSVQYRSKEGGHLVCFLRDVTERNRLESQLLQARKMEAVGTLTGGISHDFNNLLQAINGYTQLLLLDKSDTDSEYQSLKAIQDAGLRAADLVRQLLLFSRKAESTRKPMALQDEVDRARKMLERTIPKMVQIQVVTSDRLRNIHADSVQIEQMLLNLGTNAADAMPDGGKLVFEIQNTILDDDYATHYLGMQPGQYVLLTVSDTGQGMDQETIKKIFDPFFTTKEFGKGTGLGLASVYGIVKDHGGYITCYSGVGQGTTFKIYFPAVKETEAEESRAGEPKPIARGTETILLVDDEESIRDFTRKALLKFGYTVLTASTGEEAIGLYSTKPDEIDLIVMDLGMPGMGGHKCLLELLRIDPAVRVIVASGYSTNDQIKKSLELKAKGFVGKPYLLADLLTTVRAVLDEQKG